MSWNPYPKGADDIVSDPLFDAPDLSLHTNRTLARFVTEKFDDLENFTAGNKTSEAILAKFFIDLTIRVSEAAAAEGAWRDLYDVADKPDGDNV